MPKNFRDKFWKSQEIIKTSETEPKRLSSIKQVRFKKAIRGIVLRTFGKECRILS